MKTPAMISLPLMTHVINKTHAKAPRCLDDFTKNLSPNEDYCHDKPSTPRNMVNPKKMKMTQQQRLITTRHPTYQFETDSMQKLSPSEKSYKG